MNKKSLGLAAVALSAAATVSAVSQEEIATLRSFVDMAEYTEVANPAAMTQRVEGLAGQTRAFNAPSMEQFEDHLALLEREYALEQQELRAVRMKEVALQEASEVEAQVRAAQEEMARTRTIELNQLLEEQMAAEDVVLATQTYDMLQRSGLDAADTADEQVSVLRSLLNRMTAIFS